MERSKAGAMDPEMIEDTALARGTGETGGAIGAGQAIVGIVIEETETVTGEVRGREVSAGRGIMVNEVCGSLNPIQPVTCLTWCYRLSIQGRQISVPIPCPEWQQRQIQDATPERPQGRP